MTTRTLGFGLTKLKYHVCRKSLDYICSVKTTLKKERMKMGIPEGENLEDYNNLLLKLQAAPLSIEHVWEQMC